MIIKILKIIIFLILFTSCYFLSCQGLTKVHQNDYQNECEESCSRSNIECCRDCEYSFQSHTTNTAGNGCDGRYNDCIRRCQDMYNNCIERCKVIDLE